MIPAGEIDEHLFRKCSQRDPAQHGDYGARTARLPHSAQLGLVRGIVVRSRS